MYGELLGLVTDRNVIANKDMAWPYNPETVTSHESQHMTPSSLPLWSLAIGNIQVPFGGYDWNAK